MHKKKKSVRARPEDYFFWKEGKIWSQTFLDLIKQEMQKSSRSFCNTSFHWLLQWLSLVETGEGVGVLCSESIKGATQSLNLKLSQDVSLSNLVGRPECGLSDPAVGKK